MILSDGGISQMIEKVVLPEAKEHDMNQFDWAIKGGKPLDAPFVKVTYASGERQKDYDAYDRMTVNKWKEMHDKEQRWEEFELQDAEVVLVAIGISSRVCKSAVRRARAAGVKLGLLRPISVWPFPEKAFANLPESVKALCTVEMSLTGQMAQDVCLASRFRYPVYSHLTSKYVPKAGDIVEYCKGILAGTEKELEVF